MTTKLSSTEKILSEALELHEKGVSLHSIVRIYPEHRMEIEELFADIATISLEKEKIRVPENGLETILAALPKTEILHTPRAIKSPFTGFFSSFSKMTFVFPIALLVILTGGLALQKNKQTATVAIAPKISTPTIDTAKKIETTTPITKTVPTPMSMAMLSKNMNPTDRMVASFTEEAANEALIAQQNDASAKMALSAQKDAASNPIQSYEY